MNNKSPKLKKRTNKNTINSYFRHIYPSRNTYYQIGKCNNLTDEQKSKMIMSKGKDLKFLNEDSFKTFSCNSESSMYSSLDLSPDHQSGLNFKIEKIPKNISLLKNLKELKLDTNDLRVLAPEIGDLLQLERLSLSNNNLTMLPDTLGNMINLQSLHLANNKFKKIPHCIFNMHKLVFLDLTSNNIIEIDRNIKNLKYSLKRLSFYGNQIQVLSDWIDDLSNLEELWLGNNKLTTIPLSITNIKSLDWSHNYISVILDENPIEKPPLRVCRKGFSAIKHWYNKNNHN
jgi:Leucine-rich repeat (LRR) protein